MASRIDLLIEVQWPSSEEPTDGEAMANVVMVESKIGSGEGQNQLRRHAEHLDAMAGFGGRTLLYSEAITQGVTMEEARENLKDAIQLLFEVRREDAEKELEGRDVIRGTLNL